VRCVVDSCGRDERYTSRGLCNMHYLRFMKYGIPTYTERTHRFVPGGEAFYLLDRCVYDKETGCWNFKSVPSPNGYCHIRFNGKTKQAHREVYELFLGKIKDGLQIDHICRNRRCVNPDHLEPVTTKENIARGVNGRSKVACINGHLLSGDNVRFRTNSGWRKCRTCEREHQRKRRLERKNESVYC
jgi:hypothetical protein